MPRIEVAEMRQAIERRQLLLESGPLLLPFLKGARKRIDVPAFGDRRHEPALFVFDSPQFGN
jgi:hypothetical protein